MIDETMIRTYQEVMEAHKNGDFKKADELVREYVALLETKNTAILSREEIKSKIEKEIESGDIDLFISPPHKDSQSYAVIKGEYERMLPYATNERKNIALRRDEYATPEWTRDNILNEFVEDVYRLLLEGTCEVAPIWFRSTEKSEEKLKQLYP